MSEDYKASTPEKRKVLGELKLDPNSPTANLRLLTTLASYYRKSESPEILQTRTSEANEAAESTSEAATGISKLLPRKEKSLSLLCNKFLQLYPLNVGNIPKALSLNSTAEKLGTEKRRIYDIINVLESLEMATKAGKNQYYWHGNSRLYQTLSRLKNNAIELGLESKIQEIQKVNKAYIEEPFVCSSPLLMVPQSPVVNYCLAQGNFKEDKSLSVMCRKFVMLFLVSLPNGVINLDIAAKVLINEPDALPDASSSNLHSRYKTKVRRLYDIANVLSAIGLIEKIDLHNCVIRKPIFKYTGPIIDCLNDSGNGSSTDCFGLDSNETPVVENGNKSLIGMMTPSKRRNFSSRNHRMSSLGSSLSATPISTKREPKKRKLFDIDLPEIASKFERTKSSPCLTSVYAKDRLDDSILQVAELELQRIKSVQCKPKVCTKLFPRYNSDLCGFPVQVVSQGQVHTDTNETLAKLSKNVAMSVPMVSKENLIKENDVLSGFSEFNTEVSLSSTQCTEPASSALVTTTPKSLPKFIKLSQFDFKKLVPISQDEAMKIPHFKNLPENLVSKKVDNIKIFAQIPVKKIEPGDTFKAVKVGDTFQFIPVQKSSNDQ